jgi:xanthine dehydrogenase YagR molybdenum-binding subunit
MAKELFSEGQQANALDRVDGRQKVTGAAKYSAEYQIPNLTYAVLVESTIAKGRIKNLDTKKAENAPGILAIIHHGNAPKVPGYDAGGNPAKPPTGGEPFRIFQSAKIYFGGQPIAVVVACNSIGLCTSTGIIYSASILIVAFLYAFASPRT